MLIIVNLSEVVGRVRYIILVGGNLTKNGEKVSAGARCECESEVRERTARLLGFIYDFVDFNS